MFQSLVQAIKDGYPLDETIEKKAVNLLNQIRPPHFEIDRFIHALAQRPAAPNQFIHPFLPPPPAANGFMDDFISPPSSPDLFEDDFISSIDPFEDGFPSPPTSPYPFILDLIPPPAAANDIIPRVPPPATGNNIIPRVPPPAAFNGFIPDFPPTEEADQLILNLVTSSPDEALTDFMASVTVLLSVPSQRIITATITMLKECIDFCSESFVQGGLEFLGLKIPVQMFFQIISGDRYGN